MRTTATTVSRRTRPTVAAIVFSVLAAGVGLAGCGNDDDSAVRGGDTVATADTAATETTTETATETTAAAGGADTTGVPATEVPEATETTDPALVESTDPEPDSAPADSAPVASLAADSPTCQAFAVVKELNSSTEGLTNEFTQKVLSIATSGQEGGKEALEAELETFVKEFSRRTDEFLPKLKSAYASLAAEQPQFADELASIERVSVTFLEAFAKIKGSDLDRLDEVIAEALPTGDAVAAGLASLEIDKFSRAACDLPFANT